ncbi:MAG: helix-hairpin-helix domain-containing protein [Candidatus Latescibacterota bacterium]|nr:MAG: helix-hairpin-helix domain-containing protein [Candidatus Latescibacterota bacterium]
MTPGRDTSMSSRQRGALWLLLLLGLGRLLDALDLPFERREFETAGSPAETNSTPQDALFPHTETPSASGGTDEGSTRAPIPPKSMGSDSSGTVAINVVGARELQRLPGVGPVLASRIVAHRDANGPFRSLGDLQKVRGIGASTAARLAPLVRFD